MRSISLFCALSYAYYINGRYYIPNTRDLRYDGFRIFAIVLSSKSYIITTGGFHISIDENTRIDDYGLVSNVSK